MDNSLLHGRLIKVRIGFLLVIFVNYITTGYCETDEHPRF